MNQAATSRPFSPAAAAAASNSVHSNDSNSRQYAGDECGNCGRKEKWLIHNVRCRTVYRRLCTDCTLRLNPGSFCPICFTVYENSHPPPAKRLTCSKCSSLTHSHCAAAISAASDYLCPPCANPSFSFFALDPDRLAIDKKIATVFLCAARIASFSVHNGIKVARTEAERRVREASGCRKRARDALEQALFLAGKDKVMAARAVAAVATSKGAESMEVSGSGYLGKAETEGVLADGVAKILGGSSAGTMVNNGNVNGNSGHLHSNDVEKKPTLPTNHVKEEDLS